MPEFYTVSQINGYLENKLLADPFLKSIWLKGEIGNFKAHHSGHLYFSLQDEKSSLRCVMFSFHAASLSFLPHNGLEIFAKGKITVYPRDGNCQLVAAELIPVGAGNNQLALLELKEKLQKEGLFAALRKKPLPAVPEAVGAITSESGAAWQDIQKVSRARFPGIPLFLYPVLVQGENAAWEIAQAIRRANREKQVSVLLIGRGGGAREDLAAFDSEPVVRAIADSEIPVVSAVGHESDETLADLAADLRAATPSAAAALIFPDRAELASRLFAIRSRLSKQMQNKTEVGRHHLEMAKLRGKFNQPQDMLTDRYALLAQYRENLGRHTSRQAEIKRNQLALLMAKLGALDPLIVLHRGYAYVHKPDSRKPLLSAREVAVSETVAVVLAKGKLTCQVLAKEEE